jgi:archaellum component FlaC
MNEITKAEIRKRLGNISQLRELLFGDQIDEYNQRLDQYHQRLNTLEVSIQNLQKTVEICINQLEEKLREQLETVVDTWEQKTQYNNLEIHEKHHKIQQDFELLSQSTQDNLDFLHQSINSKTNRLKIEIAESKSNSDRDLTLFKQQLSHKLETHLQELTTNKISRTELAEVLFELSLKLKGGNVDLNKDLNTDLNAVANLANPQDSSQTTLD